MIKDVRCIDCNAKLAEELEGMVKIVCRKCKRSNILRSFDYKSHELMVLEKDVVYYK